MILIIPDEDKYFSDFIVVYIYIYIVLLRCLNQYVPLSKMHTYERDKFTHSQRLMSKDFFKRSFEIAQWHFYIVNSTVGYLA